MKQFIEEILAQVDIEVDGSRPWDMKINNPSLWGRVLSQGSIGLGEAYMDGWWDCDSLDQFFERFLKTGIDNKFKFTPFLRKLLAPVMNPQSRMRAFQNGKRHYDIGNDLFRIMLDRRMNYSCAYWKGAADLDSAQENKLELICRKIGLEHGQKVLDIGCGWGGFAGYAAEKYGAEVVGLTVSSEQAELANELCCNLPVQIRLQDYRSIRENFDHVVSVGMFEHVGYKNYRTFMKTVQGCLKPHGKFLLHTIGGNISSKSMDPWFEKYIFPNSMLPSARQITEAADNLFLLKDWHSFGTHYDRTLMCWHRNFNYNWGRISSNYDERFRRMWNYYMLCSAGAFRANRNQLWQIVFTRHEHPAEYESIR